MAQELLGRGHKLSTLTSHPRPPGDWAKGIAAHPVSFDDPARLAKSLAGAQVLVNTYWMRFPAKGVGFDDAVANTRILMEAAKAAGVKRVVHLSVANPSPESPFDYYRAKAAAEKVVQDSGLSVAIVRPTWIFGEGDVLLNNLAWLLRHMPFMMMVGRGRYNVQPVYVGDVARIVAELVESDKRTVVDAAGPDKMEYREFARVLKRSLAKRRLVVPLPAPLALVGGKVAGLLLRDVVATRQEMGILRASLMSSEKPPLGKVRLQAWLNENRDTVGKKWASDMGRHYRGVDLRPFKREGRAAPAPA